jgi:hypothetical protein
MPADRARTHSICGDVTPRNDCRADVGIERRGPLLIMRPIRIRCGFQFRNQPAFPGGREDCRSALDYTRVSTSRVEGIHCK